MTVERRRDISRESCRDRCEKQTLLLGTNVDDEVPETICADVMGVDVSRDGWRVTIELAFLSKQNHRWRIVFHFLDELLVITRGLITGPKIIPARGVSAPRQKVEHRLIRQGEDRFGGGNGFLETAHEFGHDALLFDAHASAIESERFRGA